MAEKHSVWGRSGGARCAEWVTRSDGPQTGQASEIRTELVKGGAGWWKATRTCHRNDKLPRLRIVHVEGVTKSAAPHWRSSLTWARSTELGTIRSRRIDQWPTPPRCLDRVRRSGGCAAADSCSLLRRFRKPGHWTVLLCSNVFRNRRTSCTSPTILEGREHTPVGMSTVTSLSMAKMKSPLVAKQKSPPHFDVSRWSGAVVSVLFPSCGRTRHR